MFLTPFPLEAPPYLPAPDVYKYIRNYAEHFDLYSHVRLNTAVRKVVRNKDNGKWQVFVADHTGELAHEFDKIIFCQGLQDRPYIPKFEGQEKFAGKVIHSQAYKQSVRYIVFFCLIWAYTRFDTIEGSLYAEA